MSRRRPSAWLVLASYLAVFAIAARPWLPAVAERIPLSSDMYDAQLIVWILAWVAHALMTQPTNLFNANINYPAPGQLTGSEHLLSAQLVFAPLDAVTSNPLLAANLTALLSYPLGALAMERLLGRLGCSAAVAWLGGLVLVLGPQRVPMNLQILQYPNVWLPVVTLALVRLRDSATPRNALLLALAFGGALASSYYMAVMAVIAAAAWGAIELARRPSGRLRFTLLALVAFAAAAALVAMVLLPYLERAPHELPGKVRIFPPLRALAAQQWRLLRLDRARVIMALVELLALVAAAARVRGMRRLAGTGLVIALVGYLLMVGTPRPLVKLTLASPLRFFRRSRFAVLAGFGTTLLVAAGLEALRRAFGRSAGLLVSAVVAALMVLPSLQSLVRFRTEPVAALTRNRQVYRGVGALAHAEAGSARESAHAVLELPLSRPWRDDDQTMGLFAYSFEPDAMVGSTQSWLPLLTGYTGYQPEQRKLVLTLIAALPDEDALRDLIDMTHVEYIQLRPASDWPSGAAHAAMREALLASPSVARAFSLGDWTILRLGRAPAHPEWFAAIAGGPRLGHTVLGTPVARLAEASAVARLSVVAGEDDRPFAGRVDPLGAGAPLVLALRVRNAGDATWPVALPPVFGLRLNWVTRPDPPRSGAVYVEARWQPLEAPVKNDDRSLRAAIPLRRDVPAGEELVQSIRIRGPSTPGRYRLELVVKQLDGARFDAPGNAPLELEVLVKAGESGPA